MKTFVVIYVCTLLTVWGFPDMSSPDEMEELDRTKRDITCASMGHRSCEWSCKLRGQATGSCAWNTTSAAYNCQCSQVKRGVRCNVGGQNTCSFSCLALGHTGGECDADFQCTCSGVNNRWGDLIVNIGNRL